MALSWLLEALVLLASLAAVIAAVAMVRRRDLLLAQVRQIAAQIAAQIAERNAEGNVPLVGGARRDLVGELDQIGRRLVALRTTERGKLEQALRLTEAVLEGMPDPVLVFDSETKISLFNDAAKALFGDRLALGNQASALGDPVLQLAAEEASVGFPIASRQVPHVTLRDRGKQRRFRLRALPLPGRGPTGAVVILQDNTESDVVAERLGHAAESALFEIQPLVDALGVTLLGEDQKTTGVDEWRAIDSVLKDVESAATDQLGLPLQPIALADLVETTLDAVAIEAQRKRVKVGCQIERPAPTPLSDTVATRRLLLRVFRSVLRRCAEGDTLRVEVRNSPRASVRVTPGITEAAVLDGLLLNRAQILSHSETEGETNVTVFQFAQGG